jgi:hypothetical protein
LGTSISEETLHTLFEDEDDYDLDATRLLASGFWLLAPRPDEQEVVPTDLSAVPRRRRLIAFLNDAG